MASIYAPGRHSVWSELAGDKAKPATAPNSQGAKEIAIPNTPTAVATKRPPPTQGASERDINSKSNSEPVSTPNTYQRAGEPKKATPGEREAPSRAVEEPCAKIILQSPQVVDGEAKEDATSPGRARANKRDEALQAVQDSAAAELGPGYRKRMASMSGLESNSERVSTINKRNVKHFSDSEGSTGTLIQQERLLKPVSLKRTTT